MILAFHICKKGYGLQMLYWKNKPIDQLTNTELKGALSESVSLMLLDKKPSDSNQLTISFIFGIAMGTIIALSGMYMVS